MSEFFRLFGSQEFYQMLLQLATPLIFAALAALVSNKAGVLNIGIEGTMLIAALAGALFSTLSGNAFIGVLAALIAGIAMGYLFSVCTIHLRTHHILVGIALNLFAAGLAVFTLYAITGNKSDYPGVAMHIFDIWLLKDIPFIGKILFTDINILVYIALLLVPATWFLFEKTVLGLRIKAVGKNVFAAESVGIEPKRIQTIALLIAGGLAGLGGAYLSLGYMSGFNTGMIAGRGFIGIAAEAIGGGNPWFTMLFAILFGTVNAFSLTAQTFSSITIPYELLNTLPYFMTVIGLVVFSIIRYRKLQKK